MLLFANFAAVTHGKEILSQPRLPPKLVVLKPSKTLGTKGANFSRLYASQAAATRACDSFNSGRVDSPLEIKLASLPDV